MQIPDALLPGPAEGPRWRVAARPLQGPAVREWDPAHWQGTLASKRELLRRFPELVSVDTGEADDACAEVASRVLGGADAAPVLPARTALEVAALSVPDDLVVLDVEAPGGPRIVAAVVCAPNRWDPRDKIGRPMSLVHAPVPGYAEQIGAATDSLLGRLAPERPVWRSNWALLADRSPHQARIWDADRRCAPEDLWLRVEEQTLSKMPVTGAVLFAIRTRQERLADLAARKPSAVADLAGAVSRLPDSVADYKSITRHREGFLRWAAETVGSQVV